MARRKEKRSRKKNRSRTNERRGKPPETLAEYNEAVAIYTYHVEEKGRADLAVDLAMNLTNRSDVLRKLGMRWTPLSRPKNGDPSLLSPQ